MARVLHDLSAHRQLNNMAATINRLAVTASDARLELCKAIAAAMDMVSKESNMSWPEWADAKLRQADGSKWSLSTLYTYASYGRDPAKLEHVRQKINEHGKSARRALSFKHRDENRRQMTPSAITVDNEVRRLMLVWRGVSVEAQRQFLALVATEG